MTALTIADHAATFTAHPLEGSSRFGLLGMLAGLNGLVSVFTPEPATDEQRRIAQEFREAGRDDRELAVEIFGERVVDVMFGKTDPVRVTVSEPAYGVVTAELREHGTKIADE